MKNCVKCFSQSNKKIDSQFVAFVEKINPDVGQFKVQYNYINYIALYRFAANYCYGKDVLDAAAGLGFGSYYLAQIANQVVGLDLVKQKINFASNRYKNHNLNFLISDATETGFNDLSFDVIVSIETFEHIYPDKSILFLKEIKRMLRPGGILVISTPNKNIYRQIARTSDHINEMNVKDFFALLREVFDDIEPYYQRKGIFKSMRTFYSIVKTDRFKIRNIIPRKIRNMVNRLVTPELSEGTSEMLDKLEVHKADQLEELEDAVIQIAVCKK